MTGRHDFDALCDLKVRQANPLLPVRLMAVLAVLAIALFCLAHFAPARAHSFYPWECCHDRDCWPMGVDADAREPEPVETAAGWRLHDGIVIPFAETRPSPDGRFHVCRGGGRLEGPVIAPSGRKPCLWAPAPSS
ncbi:hypothetical protein ACFPOB_31015 [Bosea eneae]|uniref:Uncharacterized protein n=1 Tax=Bosea eneae TaxID=151454 RepID=A0ABW0J2C6_9HYPH